MTREEAFKRLEQMYDFYAHAMDANKNYPLKGDAEAIKVALLVMAQGRSAHITREQVEKVWRGEWVKRHKHRGGFRRVKGFDDMGEQHEVTIDERCEYNDLYCSKCGKQSPDNFLNFCGYCGAPMTDKAVDILWKRLEALKDGN